MSWMVFFSKLLSPNFHALAKTSKAIQLISISVSHYCEIATWALKLQKIPFEEYGYDPLQHVFPTLAVGVGDKSQRHLSTSSRTTAVPSPHLNEEERAAKMAKEIRRDQQARATAAPVAVCPDGTIWKDSWEIATQSGLNDIDPELKTLLDERVGPLTRQYAYGFLLKPKHSQLFTELCTAHHHWLWKLLWNLFLGKQVRSVLMKTMKADDPAAVEECKEKLAQAMKELDAIIQARTGSATGSLNDKKTFLSGEAATPGLADIAVAALVAPLVNPPLYRDGLFEQLFERVRMSDDEVLKNSDLWRNSIAGKFTMEFYAKYR
mmetsp:Transcript_7874/g.13039  ORF Transcript_7874/g.13039 Transcript_7874/m.13039 type:complete len:321 (+) Transcript_7874:122-1084(+)|eukprot:CAMPEP_0174981528 /NCGR_PEP_ID=MMETSP0004_2-20121128/15946_1 /TAXON_ID=420556 /ORGANISM="Ochromonas sp., Strain CCMP1393" /LENGTH=320 /DNA_ID=CAMNT_0016233295 /DNA_START=133 /DNA_END=1095 /DNA_ORIENTATION=+